MTVHFSKSFLKDLQKIGDHNLKIRVKEVILSLESTRDIFEIKETKKLKGYPNAYRIRISDYRLGFFIVNQEVILKRFVKRNDIYKVFP